MRKAWVLEMAGLREHRRNRTAELPGGWKQRLALGCAVLHEPPILFLDEPSAGLDPVTAAGLDELILTLRQSLGVTTILVTHELASIFHVVDNCIVLDRQAKGIIARGNPGDLRDRSSDPRIQAFFQRRPTGSIA